MTAVLHSNALLKAALATEDERLDQDRIELAELQKHSKQEIGFLKSQAKKVCRWLKLLRVKL
jgi:hypothetical protein